MRTKYDRMFERKNQSILAPHYSALISHEDAAEDGDDDDVFTLARRDHDIDGDEHADPSILEETDRKTPITADGDSTPLISAEDMSKRKLKAATSKKAMLKSRPAADKLIFDERTGEARNFYESGMEVEKQAGGEESRRKFLEEERERMKEAHRVDKEVAREKKREKKRKRQERERERERQMAEGGSDDDEDGGGGQVAVIGGGDWDDANYSEEEEEVPKVKKSKKHVVEKGGHEGLEDDEALALRLLQGS